MSRIDSGFWMYYLFIWSNINFLHNSQWITQSCLVLFSFCSNYYYHYFFFFYSLRIFHIIVSWWFFTGVWVTTTPLKSPGLFSVFKQVSAMLQFGLSPRHPLISQSSSPFTNTLVTIPSVPITIGIADTFMFQSFFNSLASSRYVCFFLFSFNFTLQLYETAKSTIMYSSLFFVDYYKVWSSGQDYVIRLYLKIQEEFVHLIR